MLKLSSKPNPLNPEPQRGLPTWLRRWGLQQPDIHRNPRFWPLAWTYGPDLVDNIVALAKGAHEIADVGCGSGWLSWEMIKSNPQVKVQAIDTDRRRVEWGQQNYELRRDASADGMIEFFTQKAEEFEWLPGSLDLVVASFALSCMNDPVPLLEKMVSALRPGGHLVYYDATEPTPLNLDRLARWHHRWARFGGQLSDLWNQRRAVQSAYSKDAVRSARPSEEGPQVPLPEADVYAWLQNNLQVAQHARRRAVIDLVLLSLNSRRLWLTMPPLLLMEKVLLSSGYLEGCCRFAVLRKPG